MNENKEPVAWLYKRFLEYESNWYVITNYIKDKEKYNGNLSIENTYNIPLYLHPKEWQGLIDDEIEKVFKSVSEPLGKKEIYEIHTFAKAIEEKLKEKNI